MLALPLRLRHVRSVQFQSQSHLQPSRSFSFIRHAPAPAPALALAPAPTSTSSSPTPTPTPTPFPSPFPISCTTAPTQAATLTLTSTSTSISTSTTAAPTPAYASTAKLMELLKTTLTRQQQKPPLQLSCRTSLSSDPDIQALRDSFLPKLANVSKNAPLPNHNSSTTAKQVMEVLRNVQTTRDLSYVNTRSGPARIQKSRLNPSSESTSA